jgi:hypothetical protein
MFKMIKLHIYLYLAMDNDPSHKMFKSNHSNYFLNIRINNSDRTYVRVE